MFLVKYRDDFSKIHLVVIQNINEFKFVRNRFEILEYSPIKAL